MAIMCQIQTQGFWLKSMSFYNWRLPFGKHLFLKVFFPTHHFTWLKHKNQFQLVKKKVIVNQWSLEPQCKQEPQFGDALKKDSSALAGLKGHGFGRYFACRLYPWPESGLHCFSPSVSPQFLVEKVLWEPVGS